MTSGSCRFIHESCCFVFLFFCFFGECCAPHVGTVYSLRADCKQLSSKHNVGTNISGGDFWKGIPFCVCRIVLCLGLKSSDDLLKVTLALWWPLARSVPGRNRPPVDPSGQRTWTENGKQKIWYFLTDSLGALAFSFSFYDLVSLKGLRLDAPVSNLNIPGHICTKTSKKQKDITIKPVPGWQIKTTRTLHFS